jgi:hypothetical protein
MTWDTFEGLIEGEILRELRMLSDVVIVFWTVSLEFNDTILLYLHITW